MIIRRFLRPALLFAIGFFPLFTTYHDGGLAVRGVHMPAFWLMYGFYVLTLAVLLVSESGMREGLWGAVGVEVFFAHRFNSTSFGSLILGSTFLLYFLARVLLAERIRKLLLEAG